MSKVNARLVCSLPRVTLSPKHFYVICILQKKIIQILHLPVWEQDPSMKYVFELPSIARSAENPPQSKSEIWLACIPRRSNAEMNIDSILKMHSL